ncbi:MAG TPA: tRNA (adenosine(37)-N6)-threonylcarbamoyltransferase complex dimerization subunit type 1 TsaB [Halothiobacillus sp.]|nr:tRNA (adenosine(37)-N6)-threonylcarbamoyltransferase complex dimerization subunit type 1 TsaB [Halothiobacillus sp.]HQS28186.1 tRNA (adenosine(37)-N6)-threonylcarbamoyltransferase complex dimerization subunit type 1 TsaB [Halothiobacillus sp.]HUM99363.1 tRNA (adenosine(37)-N6)-threonylcarbamoyltransferase complex dimerization subunit type 1 TsaB [Halothiobacillus sp.]
MNILFIDSATEACTVGLWFEGEIISRFELAPRAHTRLLLPMVQAVFDEAGINLSQLDLIAFGRGPGSFTGVRIATACAQGIALGLDIPVLGVSTLATLAQAQASAQRLAQPSGANLIIHAAIDARMGEVYHAAFELNADSIVPLIGAERVLTPAALLAEWAQHPPGLANNQTAPLMATGSGFGRYPELIQAAPWQNVCADALPDARFALALAAAAPQAAWQDPADAVPVYLRDNVAQVKAS